MPKKMFYAFFIIVSVGLCLSLISNYVVIRENTFIKTLLKENLNISNIKRPVYPYKNPSEVLYSIYFCDVNKDYNGLDKMIHNVMFKADYNSRDILNSFDFIVKGIKNKSRYVSSFAYTPKGLLYHALKVDKLAHIPSKDEVEKYLDNYPLTGIDLYMREIIQNESKWKDLLVYRYEQTFIAFIKINGSYKLLVTSNLDLIYEKE